MASFRPRIAIPVPTSADFEYNGRSWKQYAAAVIEAGGEPVEAALGLDGSALRRLAESCDGVCLPGSPADVDPSRYGAERDPETAPVDLAREIVDFFLLDHADAAGKPALGICFGVQSMNVWAGGSLVQDLNPVPVNHSAGARVVVAHSALVAADSHLAALLGSAEALPEDGFLRLPVNSSHHQAVASPGDGFRIVARCPEDGVIEAIERDESAGSSESPAWMLGVQWHPERSISISAASRAIFQKLVVEANKVAAASEAVSGD